MRKNFVVCMAVPGTAIHSLTLWPASLVSAGQQPSLAVAANLLYADISSQIKTALSNAIAKRSTVSETVHRRQHSFLTGWYNHNNLRRRAATVLLPESAIPVR